MQRNMPALVRSLRRLGPSHLAFLTLVLAACATAQEPDEVDGNGSGNAPAVGGGSGTTNAGASSTGGKGGSGVIVTGGLPGTTTAGTGNLPTGGKPAGTAGTATTTAGTGTGTAGAATGTGGSSSSTCPQYTGTVGASAESLIFQGGFGTSKGTTPWTGYGYTYTYGTAKIAPGTGNGCFVNKQMCANGTVPADDDSGAGIGWNIKQASGAMAKEKVAVTTPVKVTLAGFKAGMRVSLSASSSVSYCHILTTAEAMGTAIPLTGFAEDCWLETPTLPYEGSPIEAIQVVVPGSKAAAVPSFDFCIIDIEPG
jgi:hypothetical protein